MNTPASEHSAESLEGAAVADLPNAEKAPAADGIVHPDLENAPEKNSGIDIAVPSSVKNDTPPIAPLGLRASDRLFILFLSAAIFVLSVIHLLRLSWRGTPAFEIERLPSHAVVFQIDINQASWVEWMQLPEIGEAMARKIVADREERGRFQSVEDVRRVRGIGPVTMEKIRPYLKDEVQRP